MEQRLANEVAELLGNLYFDAPGARALLIGIGYRAPQIPDFRSAATFWPEVVLRLGNGIVADGIRQVLTAVVREHPGNAEAAALLAKSGGAAAGQTTVDSAVSPVPVLCLFTDPVRRSKIRIDREARQLKEIERLGGVSMEMWHAVRTRDIVPALRAARPRILHVGGHGTPDGGLVFEDEYGDSVAVGVTALADAIAAACPVLDCVVLNSCFTAANAETFRHATRAVAGAVTSLGDDCALAFARGFYTAVGAGDEAGKAYEAGRVEVSLSGRDTAGLRFMAFDPDAGATGTR